MNTPRLTFLSCPESGPACSECVWGEGGKGGKGDKVRDCKQGCRGVCSMKPYKCGMCGEVLYDAGMMAGVQCAWWRCGSHSHTRHLPHLLLRRPRRRRRRRLPAHAHAAASRAPHLVEHHLIVTMHFETRSKRSPSSRARRLAAARSKRTTTSCFCLITLSSAVPPSSRGSCDAFGPCRVQQQLDTLGLAEVRGDDQGGRVVILDRVHVGARLEQDGHDAHVPVLERD